MIAGEWVARQSRELSEQTSLSRVNPGDPTLSFKLIYVLSDDLPL